MRTVLAITGNQLLRLLADRQAAFLLLAFPLVLNLILGVSLERAFSPEFRPERPYAVAVAAPEGHAAAQAVAEGLRAAEADGWLRLSTAAGAEDARRAVQEGRADAAVVLPPRFPAEPALVVAEPGTVAAGVIEEVTRGAVAAALKPPQGSVRVTVSYSAVTPSRGGARTGAMEYYAAGMSVLMVYFAARYGTLSYLRDRATGVYLRVRAGGVGRHAYLLGKFAGNVAVALVFMAVMAGATRLLFGVHWGDPAAWALLTAAAALAASGLNTALMALARTPEVMDSVSAAVFQVLGFFGGSMMPTFILPDVIARISRWVPNRWMLDGYLAVLGGAGPEAVGDAALKLAATGAILFALGWLADALSARAVGEA